MPVKASDFQGGYVVNMWCHRCRRDGLKCVTWGRHGLTVRMECVFCGKVEYRRWHRHSTQESTPKPGPSRQQAG